MYSAQSFQSAECTLPWFIVVRLPTTYKLPLSALVQSLLEILHWTGYSPVQCTISVLHTYSSCHVLIKVGIFIHIFSCEVAHHHFLWIDYSQNLKAAQAHAQHLLTFSFLSWFQSVLYIILIYCLHLGFRLYIQAANYLATFDHLGQTNGSCDWTCDVSIDPTNYF